MAKYRAYVAPSTQENNITALGQSEEYVMHLIADEIAELLKELGFEVFRGRKDQTAAQMIAEANNLTVDLYLSVHSNAFDGKTRGCVVFYWYRSMAGQRLAECVYKELESITPTADRGIKEHKSFIELKNTNMPAIIAEVDFHDNFMGALWIRDNVRRIAEAYIKGVCNYFMLEFRVNRHRQVISDIRKALEGLPC